MGRHTDDPWLIDYAPTVFVYTKDQRYADTHSSRYLRDVSRSKQKQVVITLKKCKKGKCSDKVNNVPFDASETSLDTNSGNTDCSGSGYSYDTHVEDSGQNDSVKNSGHNEVNDSGPSYMCLVIEPLGRTHNCFQQLHTS